MNRLKPTDELFIRFIELVGNWKIVCVSTYGGQHNEKHIDFIIIYEQILN